MKKIIMYPTGPTLTGILPYAGLKFYVYEKLKSHVPEEHQSSIVMRLSCGALAGLLGQTFTYPLDVVRRQMQVLFLIIFKHLCSRGFYLHDNFFETELNKSNLVCHQRLEICHLH